MATRHALQRATERLGLTLDEKIVQHIVSLSDRLAVEAGDTDTAARVWKLPRPAGSPWGDQSNGNVVVAIIRNGLVKTFMFRRETQPHTPKAYNVERCI